MTQTASEPAAAPVSFLKVLDANAHAGLKWTGCGDCVKCCDGSLYNSAFILVDELNHASRLFPTMFNLSQQGELNLALILSLKPGTPCPYLDRERKRCTIHAWGRPRTCRNFPFVAEALSRKNAPPGKPQPARYLFSFDSRCPGIREAEEGMAIIAPDKTLAPEILSQFIGDDLPRMAEARRIHQQFLTLAHNSGLLQNVSVVGTGRVTPLGPDEPERRLQLRVVRADKLQQLPDAEALALFRSGFMPALHAHLASLNNLPFFVGIAYPAATVSAEQVAPSGNPIWRGGNKTRLQGEDLSLGVPIQPVARPPGWHSS